MYEKNIERNDEMELDLRRLFKAVWKGKWIVVLTSVLCAGLVLGFTLLFVTPTYNSSAMFYVNNSIPTADNYNGVTSSDITASKNLVNSYIVILKTKESLTEVIRYANVDLTYSELRDMISAEPVDDTEIFRVVVTSPDPKEAEKVATAIAELLPQRISSIIEGTSAKAVDVVAAPKSPSFPNYPVSAVLGLLLGLLLSVGYVILREIFDTTIRTEDDILQLCKHPVLAAVPDMTVSGKGSNYEYGYGSKRKTPAAAGAGKQPILIGSDISFAAAEAYKLLRTKLQFSFTDDNTSRVLGVSSAFSGEGKSLSSINLAYTLSQMGKKVLLIDCDMRKPTLAEKLGIPKKPGLSSYLTGQCDLNALVQYCGIKNDKEAFHVLAAGQIPPNPIELLSSARMSNALAQLRKTYDYIILDFPPVGEVSDAMALADQIDGILLVVRQNYCTRPALSNAIQQFEFINARILGIICNCASEGSGKYGKHYYKNSYYKTSYARSARKYEGSRTADITRPGSKDRKNG